MDKGYNNENWKSTYERRMREAVRELNISSPDSFISDGYMPEGFLSSPDAVILENITGYTSMQLERIGELTEGTEEKLINLAGFYREKKSMKRIYVEPLDVDEGFLIPECQKFKVGSLCFESERSREISGARLIGVYAGEKGAIEDYTKTKLFGKKPKEGMELYFVFDRLPSLDRELAIYLECKESKIDLMIYDKGNKETNIEWEIYTKKGYRRIECTDDTKGFNKSGSIVFNLGQWEEEKAKPEFVKKEGYIIRGTFAEADYNSCPEINSIKGAVFPLTQKDTRSYVYTFSGQKECYIYSDIMEEQYIRVYCRKYGSRLYRKCNEEEYERIRQDYGRYCYSFKEIYKTIAVAAYSEDAVRVCELGCIYGYDNEEFDLPFDNIIESCFSVILEIPTEEGAMYDFVKPKIPGAMGFVYEINERTGKLRVISVGECAGSKLYIGEAATVLLTEGTLLKETELTPSGYDTDVRFLNVADTVYGGMEESFDELRRRFVSDVYKSYTAVTAKDYEDIVMDITEVNVQRVKAVGSSKENKVTIAVYIKGMKKGDVLSDISKSIIMKEINKRRLLTTKVALVSPVFTAININAVIMVKKHYEHCEKQIREAIVQLTDYVKCGKGFGELLMFEELYDKIQGLSCVSYIISLDMAPGNYRHASEAGSDIKPADNCLLMPGSIRLTLNYEKEELN